MPIFEKLSSDGKGKSYRKTGFPPALTFATEFRVCLAKSAHGFYFLSPFSGVIPFCVSSGLRGLFT